MLYSLRIARVFLSCPQLRATSTHRINLARQRAELSLGAEKAHKKEELFYLFIYLFSYCSLCSASCGDDFRVTAE